MGSNAMVFGVLGLAGLGALALMAKGAPRSPVIPADAEPIPTLRDSQGRVIPRPNVTVDPKTGKSYIEPQAPETRGSTPANAVPPKPTVADPTHLSPDMARSLAPRVAAEIRARGKSYDRAIVKQFQHLAGLHQKDVNGKTVSGADGRYGGRTRGALVFYGVTDAPPTVYLPHDTVPYKLTA